MEVEKNLSLEKTLCNFSVLKPFFNEILQEKQTLYCGIKTIDKIIEGFHTDKIYTIVLNPGMGLRPLISSVFENFNLLYDKNFSLEKSIEKIKTSEEGEEVFFDRDNNFKTYLLPIEITKRKKHQKRPTIKDIPESLLEKSDVVIALYRPEYYKIDTWEDGTSTENQIEFSVLKNHKQILGSVKLYLDIENIKVRSIRQSAFSLNWTNRMIKWLNEENNENK